MPIEHLSPSVPVNMADEWYPVSTEDHFWFQWRFDVLCQLLKGFDLGKEILEVGCGSGVARQQIERHFQVPVHGCDLNEGALKLSTPGSGKLYVYDIHDRRAEWKNHFDTIFLLDTLEHIDDAREFLESVGAHLCHGGLLVINVPAQQWLFSRYDQVAGHVKRYNKHLLHRELKSVGLDVLRCEYWGLSTVPLLVVRKVVLRFTRRDKVIRRGFQPTALSDTVLRTLMRTERRFIRHPWVGTSLAAVASKA